MKRLLIVFTSLLFLIGCGIREKAEDKVSEKIMEKATGSKKVDVDRDGEKITIEGEDGEKLSIGSGKWPETEFANSLPKFDKGKIVSVIELENGFTVAIEDAKASDVEAYVEEVQKTFNNDKQTVNSEGYFRYFASSDSEEVVSITYSDDYLSIVFSRSDE